MTKPSLTAERLRACLVYDAETGVFTYRIVRHYLQKLGAVAGAKHGNGYLRIVIDGGHHYAHRLAWLYVYGEWPSKNIDHINGDRSDNRIANLRDATQGMNLCNKRIQSNNRCGLKGVSWHRAAGKWIAQIGVRGEHVYLGLFESPEDAHQAYCQAAQKLHGEFARAA